MVIMVKMSILAISHRKKQEKDVHMRMTGDEYVDVHLPCN